MAKEIERKFLVKDDSYKAMAKTSYRITQGYLSRKIEATVRVRIINATGFLTVKGANKGATRDEWEYTVPADDAAEMLARCAEPPVIDKTRYIVDYAGFVWEVDEFHGDLDGLVLAEVELPSEDSEVALPPFVSTEVTGDARYYNSALGRSALN